MFALQLLSETRSQTLRTDETLYDGAVLACARANQCYDAAVVLGDMRLQQLQPSMDLYSAAVRTCQEGNQWQVATDLLAQMRSLEPAVGTGASSSRAAAWPIGEHASSGDDSSGDTRGSDQHLDGVPMGKSRSEASIPMPVFRRSRSVQTLQSALSAASSFSPWPDACPPSTDAPKRAAEAAAAGQPLSGERQAALELPPAVTSMRVTMRERPDGFSDTEVSPHSAVCPVSATFPVSAGLRATRPEPWHPAPAPPTAQRPFPSGPDNAPHTGALDGDQAQQCQDAQPIPRPALLRGRPEQSALSAPAEPPPWPEARPPQSFAPSTGEEPAPARVPGGQHSPPFAASSTGMDGPRVMAGLGAARPERWHSALALLEAQRRATSRPDIASYNETLAACAESQHWEIAQELFHSMTEAGLQPNATTFDILTRLIAGGSTHGQLAVSWNC